MFCTNCGAECKEGAKFCSSCGQNLILQQSPSEQAAPSSVSESATQAVNAEPAAAQAQDAAPEPVAQVPAPATATASSAANTPLQSSMQASNPKKKVFLAVGLVVVLLVVAGIVFFVFTSTAQKSEAVLITNSIEGLDTSTGTKIPVQVTGTDAKGNVYDQRFYADGVEPIEVPTGSYTFTVAASPIAQDGTIYNVEGASVEGTVGDGGLEDSGIEISLDPIEAIDVTDEEIEAAYEAAIDGGAADESAAEALKDAATKRRDDAVAQKQAEEEAQKAAEEAAAQEQAEQSSSASASGSYAAAQAANKLAGSQWQYASGSSYAVTSIQFGSGGDGHESTFNKATGQEESDYFMMSYDAERSDGTVFVYVLSYDSGRTMSVYYNPAADTLTDGDGISLTRIR